MLYLNDQPLSVTIFPDKTSQVWKLPAATFEKRKQSIRWDFESEAEVMHLAQLQHLLLKKIYGVETTLTIKYLPYARQDKEVANDATFALKTFLWMINTIGFHKIIVMDPHNFDAVRVSCQFEAKYPTHTLLSVFRETDPDLICYPDHGALVKYQDIYDIFGKPYIFADKVRDQSTGNITSYNLRTHESLTPQGKNVIVLDDICDGGMTFKLLAKDLLAAGAKSVVLFVTHGIFSKGLQTLKDSGIQRIYTQDGEASEEAGRIIYRRL